MNVAKERIRLWNEWLATPEARGYDGASQDIWTRFQRTEGRLWVAERLVAELESALAASERRRGELEAIAEAYRKVAEEVCSPFYGDYPSERLTENVRRLAGLPAAPAGVRGDDAGDSGTEGTTTEAPASRREGHE